MKYLITLTLILCSTNVFSSRCSDHFASGEDAYLSAVDFNKQANSEMREANIALRNGDIGIACAKVETAAPSYQAALELMSDAVLDMMPASRNCLRRRDRNRALDNLDLLKQSSASVKANLDQAIKFYSQYCE